MKSLNQYIVEGLSKADKERLLQKFEYIINQDSIGSESDLNYITKHLDRLQNMVVVGDFIKEKGLEKIHITKNAINNIFTKEKNLNNIFNQVTGIQLINLLKNKSGSILDIFSNLKEHKLIYNDLEDIFYDIQQAGRLSVGQGEYFLRCMLSDINSNDINNSKCDIICNSGNFEVKFLNRDVSNSTASIFGGGSAFKEVKKEKEAEEQEDNKSKNSPSRILNDNLYKNGNNTDYWNNVKVKFDIYMNGGDKTSPIKKDGIFLFIRNGNGLSNIMIDFLSRDVDIEEIKTFMKNNNLIFTKFASAIEVRAINNYK